MCDEKKLKEIETDYEIFQKEEFDERCDLIPLPIFLKWILKREKKAREETEARLTKKFSNYLDRLSETHQKSSLLNVHEVLDEVETYLTERGHGSLGLAVRVRVIEKLSRSVKEEV